MQRKPDHLMHGFQRSTSVFKRIVGFHYWTIIYCGSPGRINEYLYEVAYDIELAAEAIESSDMPREYAQMLRAGVG
jgi:hypothetical protein